MTVEQVMEEYELVRGDVLACIAYGAEMSRSDARTSLLGKTA